MPVEAHVPVGCDRTWKLYHVYSSPDSCVFTFFFYHTLYFLPRIECSVVLQLCVVLATSLIAFMSVTVCLWEGQRHLRSKSKSFQLWIHLFETITSCYIPSFKILSKLYLIQLIIGGNKVERNWYETEPGRFHSNDLYHQILCCKTCPIWRFASTSFGINFCIKLETLQWQYHIWI